MESIDKGILPLSTSTPLELRISVVEFRLMKFPDVWEYEGTLFAPSIICAVCSMQDSISISQAFIEDVPYDFILFFLQKAGPLGVSFPDTGGFHSKDACLSCARDGSCRLEKSNCAFYDGPYPSCLK